MAGMAIGTVVEAAMIKPERPNGGLGMVERMK